MHAFFAPLRARSVRARLAPILVLGLALGLSACGSQAPRPTATTGLLAPTGAAAERYGDLSARPNPESQTLRDQVLAEARRLADQAKRTAPALSEPLSAAAEALAAASGGDTPDATAIDFAAGHFGLTAPIPSVMVMRGNGAPADFVHQLSGVLDQVLRRGHYNRLGVGAVPLGEEQVIVVLLQEDRVELTPIPRHLPVAGTARVTGRLTGGFQQAQVLVTGVDGQVATLHTGGDQFDTEFRCGGEGRHRVEVMGSNRLGPAVLANFSVYCGAPPPTQLAITLGGGSSLGEREAEQALLDLVNRERKQQSLPPLKWDERLADVARGHSRDMRQHGFVGHISPTTGGPGDRTRKAHLIAATVEENVGVGASPEGVHAGLMESPGHRAAILSPTATRLGVGVVRRPRQGAVDYFATELFTTPPAPIDLAAARARVEAGLSAGAPGRIADEGLRAVAQSLADDLAQGRLKQDATQTATRQRIEARHLKIAALAAMAGVGPTPETLLKDPLITRKDLPRVGLGMAAGQQDGYPALFTVILLGR